MASESVAVPVAVEQFQFSRSAFTNIPFIAAIDKGCSLTKILYEDKDSATSGVDDDHVTVTCETYLNRDLFAALDRFCQRVYRPAQLETLTLLVTGAGCERNSHDLYEYLQSNGLTPKFVDEFFSQAKGMQFLIENLDEEKMFFPEKLTYDTFNDHLPTDGFFAYFNDQLKVVLEERKEKYLKKVPAFVAFVGSATIFVDILEEGEAKFRGVFMMSGKSFLGLSQLILGTSNFNEIMSLAEAGDCRNVDTQFGECLWSTAESAYGNNDPEGPFFSFGKVADRGKPLSSYKREDLANSLVKMFAEAIAIASLQATIASGHFRIYMAGNFSRSKLFRDYFLQQMTKDMLMTINPFEVRFLSTGHTAAFGALHGTNDKNKIF